MIIKSNFKTAIFLTILLASCSKPQSSNQKESAPATPQSVPTGVGLLNTILNKLKITETISTISNETITTLETDFTDLATNPPTTTQANSMKTKISALKTKIEKLNTDIHHLTEIALCYNATNGCNETAKNIMKQDIAAITDTLNAKIQTDVNTITTEWGTFSNSEQAKDTTIKNLLPKITENIKTLQTFSDNFNNTKSALSKFLAEVSKTNSK